MTELQSEKPVLQPMLIYSVLAFFLLFSFITKVWRIHKPDAYVFDEIYYGFTAEEYAKGNIKAWVWDYTPPQGFAYAWDHPPLGKLALSVPIRVLGVSSWARRIVPLVSGVMITLLTFWIAQQLFPTSPLLWLMSAGFTTLDGLILSLSRIALVDTTLTCFILAASLSLLKKRYFWSSLFFGAAVASKWSGIYILGIVGLFLLLEMKWQRAIWPMVKSLTQAVKTGILFLFSGIIIYVLSYTPLLTHYGYVKLWELQKQMYWYHTHLTATHPFQSNAYTWPIMYRPVWFWVEYGQETVSNIYAMGNPLLFWLGLLAVFFSLGYALIAKEKRLAYLLIAYGMFWIPWIFSPRIMFLYHYSPSVPFLCILLAFMLYMLWLSHRYLQYLVLALVTGIAATFVFFYPYWTGLPVPTDQVARFQWLSTWK